VSQIETDRINKRIKHCFLPRGKGINEQEYAVSETISVEIKVRTTVVSHAGIVSPQCIISTEQGIPVPLR
jgi:hypothetical protein